MRRTLLAAAIAALVAVAAGCARTSSAAPVDFALTLPLYRADSLTCVATQDTVKNLATLIVYWSSTASRTDSTLVNTFQVGGLYGRQFAFTAQQPAWTTRYYWCVTRDSTGIRACDRSNIVQKTVTAGPPARVTDLRPKP